MEQTNKSAIIFPGPNSVLDTQSFLVAGIVCFFGVIGAITSALLNGEVYYRYVILPMLLTIAFISIFAPEYRVAARLCGRISAYFFFTVGIVCFLEIGFSPTPGIIVSFLILEVGVRLSYALIAVWMLCSALIFRRTLEGKEYDEWTEREAKISFGADAEKSEHILWFGAIISLPES